MKLNADRLLLLRFAPITDLDREERRRALLAVRNISNGIALLLILMQVATVVYYCGAVNAKLIRGNDCEYGIFSFIKDSLILITLLHFTFGLSKLLIKGVKRDSDLNTKIDLASTNVPRMITYQKNLQVSDKLPSFKELSFIVKVHIGGLIVLCITFFCDWMSDHMTPAKQHISEIIAITCVLAGMPFLSFYLCKLERMQNIDPSNCIAPPGYQSGKKTNLTEKAWIPGKNTLEDIQQSITPQDRLSGGTVDCTFPLELE
ncbi:hypothetical protein NHE_0244 [Neorickettsia helminthoeca str. Oregon]|uniref:Uncharacterized protein n=1 Tax=Neorickettsia helminthoeca str. Oregon TaxID=1286528 RepID=X5H3R7_9RICK|nr:hypothetical protein [Neorickettsia helminthoeca]AHX11206.1 hypothetical protein NHE_0244 [Neorickettsia helminthoeca str. Oregon]